MQLPEVPHDAGASSTENTSAPTGDSLSTNLPPWVTGVRAAGGSWGDFGWLAAPSDTAVPTLSIDIDQATVPPAFVLDVETLQAGGRSPVLDLSDAGMQPLLAGLPAADCSGDAEVFSSRFSIITSLHPDLACLSLRPDGGHVEVVRLVFRTLDGTVFAVSLSGFLSAVDRAAAESSASDQPNADESAVLEARDTAGGSGATVTLGAGRRIWYVNATVGDDRHTGLAPTCGVSHGPFASVRRALAAAADGDLIAIAGGRYPDSIDLRGRNVQVVLTGSVDLRSVPRAQ